MLEDGLDCNHSEHKPDPNVLEFLYTMDYYYKHISYKAQGSRPYKRAYDAVTIRAPKARTGEKFEYESEKSDEISARSRI